MGEEDGFDGSLEATIWRKCPFIWAGKVYIWLSLRKFQKLWLSQPRLNKLMHFENWETDHLQHDLYVDISYKLGICFSCIYTNNYEQLYTVESRL